MRKITVAHEFYGCLCECCGIEILAIEVVDGEEYERKRRFEFDHFGSEIIKSYVENFVRVNWPEWIGVEIKIGDLICPAGA